MSEYTYSYQTMSLTASGNLSVPTDINFFLTNLSSVSTRGTPYMEIIVQLTETDTSYAIYNNVLKYLSDDNFFTTTCNSDELVIPDQSESYYKLINKNDKRVYCCDNQVYYANKALAYTPSNLYFKYKNSDYGQLTIPSGNLETPNSDTYSYAINSVSRNTIFYYYTGTTVYTLIDFTNSQNTSYGFTIYIMQSYSNQISDSVSFAALPNLYPVLMNETIVGSGNSIPKNWLYTYFVLDENTSIQAVSVGTAYLTQDGLRNSYVFLDPTYSSVIYDQTLITCPNVIANSTITTKTTFVSKNQSSSSSGSCTETADGYEVNDTLNAASDVTNSVNAAISALNTSGTGILTSVTTIETTLTKQ